MTHSRNGVSCGKGQLLTNFILSYVNLDVLRYGCGIEGCNSYFAKWSQLQKHNKDTHKSIPCTLCDKNVLKRNMAAHLKTHDDSRSQVHCKHDGCSKVFSTVGATVPVLPIFDRL